MKLSALFLSSITGTATSTVLLAGPFGQLYTITDLDYSKPSAATSFLSPIAGLNSVTKDPATGKIFLIGHDINGKDWVKEICGGTVKDVATIPGSSGFLNCATAGPRGVIAIDTLRTEYGIISNCGTYTKMGDLPISIGALDGFVFTQDDKGQLHLIDGSGTHWIQAAQGGTWVKQTISFTPNHKNTCGTFVPDKSGGTIYAGTAAQPDKIAAYFLPNRGKGALDVTGIGNILDLAVDVDTSIAYTLCSPTAPTPTVPTPTAPTPTLPTPTGGTSPTLPTPTVPTPTAPTPTAPALTVPTFKGTKKNGKKVSNPTSKGGKKSYITNGSIMTGLINTTEFNVTLGYFS